MNTQEFIAYEYKELNVKEDMASFYLDCYESFGWQRDEKFPPQKSGEKMIIKLNRNRKLVNKVELTRLQRNFEADMEDIFSLEGTKTSAAVVTALIIGLIGTAFMAGSVFAVTADPSQILLCIYIGSSGICRLDFTVFCIQKSQGGKDKKSYAVY